MCSTEMTTAGRVERSCNHKLVVSLFIALLSLMAVPMDHIILRPQLEGQGVME